MEQQRPAQVREPAEVPVEEPVEEARPMPEAQMTVEDAGCTGRAPADVMQRETCCALSSRQDVSSRGRARGSSTLKDRTVPEDGQVQCQGVVVVEGRPSREPARSASRRSWHRCRKTIL